jgi:hypothetical protein
MPQRPITAALQAVAAIVAAVAICLVLAAALHLPTSHPATPTTITPAVAPAADYTRALAPSEYVPTPAGPPTDQAPPTSLEAR